MVMSAICVGVTTDHHRCEYGLAPCAPPCLAPRMDLRPSGSVLLHLGWESFLPHRHPKQLCSFYKSPNRLKSPLCEECPVLWWLFHPRDDGSQLENIAPFGCESRVCRKSCYWYLFTYGTSVDNEATLSKVLFVCYEHCWCSPNSLHSIQTGWAFSTLLTGFYLGEQVGGILLSPINHLKAAKHSNDCQLARVLLLLLTTVVGTFFAGTLFALIGLDWIGMLQ